MADVTVIATAAISGGVGVIAAAITALASSRSAAAETRRQEARYAETRRAERKETYQTAINLLTDYGWKSTQTQSGHALGRSRERYDVVAEFTIPFVRAANWIRVYCSPESIAAMDAIQEGFAQLNRARTADEEEAALRHVRDGHDRLVIAARKDIGPRPEDGFPDVPHRAGAGPPA